MRESEGSDDELHGNGYPEDDDEFVAPTALESIMKATRRVENKFHIQELCWINAEMETGLAAHMWSDKTCMDVPIEDKPKRGKKRKYVPKRVNKWDLARAIVEEDVDVEKTGKFQQTVTNLRKKQKQDLILRKHIFNEKAVVLQQQIQRCGGLLLTEGVGDQLWFSLMQPADEKSTGLVVWHERPIFTVSLDRNAPVSCYPYPTHVSCQLKFQSHGDELILNRTSAVGRSLGVRSVEMFSNIATDADDADLFFQVMEQLTVWWHAHNKRIFNGHRENGCPKSIAECVEECPGANACNSIVCGEDGKAVTDLPDLPRKNVIKSVLNEFTGLPPDVADIVADYERIDMLRFIELLHQHKT